MIKGSGQFTIKNKGSGLQPENICVKRNISVVD